MDNPIIDQYGAKRWYNEKSQYHREDGPAIIYKDGDQYWYYNDKRHRVGGPAVEYTDGSFLWYKHGVFHREDGPAVKLNNELHWFYNGKKIDCHSTEEFLRIVKLKAFW